ncbi:MAG: cytochrome, partial [Proteobacteria bacterium]|nr:cytochrome [Pseudomonadota bacterium]
MTDDTGRAEGITTGPADNLRGSTSQPPVNLQSGALPDPETTPLSQLDVSDSRLYQQDAWRPYFARLRREDPVHFTADSPFGPYWSITRFQDIMHVESRHDVFSSFPTIAIGDSPDGQYIENFISMDPPKHDQQRRAVTGVVAPRNLSLLEPVIRGHASEILDSLPDGGEVFDWVDTVSIELTTRMLATLFDFPFEDRRKLTYWSDISIGSPETTGMDEGPSQQEVMEGLNDMASTFMGLWAERAAVDPGERNDLITMLAHGDQTHDMVNRPLEFLGN